METLYETALYIEARDLAVVPAARGNPLRIPVRIAGDTAGFIIATAAELARITLTWTERDGKGRCSQTLDVNRFSKAGQVHFCLRCPLCRTLRKRLYLRPSKTDLFTVALNPFGFVCEQCAGANL